MVEAMDHEIGRLLESMDAATRNNTIVIFIGDNGTANNTTEFWPRGHAKGSIYEGGLRVPLIISENSVFFVLDDFEPHRKIRQYEGWTKWTNYEAVQESPSLPSN